MVHLNYLIKVKTKRQCSYGSMDSKSKNVVRSYHTQTQTHKQLHTKHTLTHSSVLWKLKMSHKERPPWIQPPEYAKRNEGPVNSSSSFLGVYACMNVLQSYSIDVPPFPTASKAQVNIIFLEILTLTEFLFKGSNSEIIKNHRAEE